MCLLYHYEVDRAVRWDLDASLGQIGQKSNMRTAPQPAIEELQTCYCMGVSSGSIAFYWSVKCLRDA